jgi:hypothetical protein
MSGVTPWAICIGVFIVWPTLLFVAGFYIGRNGLPYDIRIRKKEGWGRQSDYGFVAEE